MAALVGVCMEFRILSPWRKKEGCLEKVRNWAGFSSDISWPFFVNCTIRPKFSLPAVQAVGRSGWIENESHVTYCCHMHISTVSFSIIKNTVDTLCAFIFCCLHVTQTDSAQRPSWKILHLFQSVPYSLGSHFPLTLCSDSVKYS